MEWVKTGLPLACASQSAFRWLDQRRKTRKKIDFKHRSYETSYFRWIITFLYGGVQIREKGSKSAGVQIRCDTGFLAGRIASKTQACNNEIKLFSPSRNDQKDPSQGKHSSCNAGPQLSEASPIFDSDDGDIALLSGHNESKLWIWLWMAQWFPIILVEGPSDLCLPEFERDRSEGPSNNLVNFSP